MEKVFLAASFVYVTYIFAGVLAHPLWKDAMIATFKPPDSHAFATRLICSWSSVSSAPRSRPGCSSTCSPPLWRRASPARQYKASRLDVVTGCIFTDIVAWFIIVACAATLYVHGFRDIKYAADAAQAMKPLAGDYAYILFAVGCSMPRCSRLRFCRSRRPIPCAKGWVSNPA